MAPSVEQRTRRERRLWAAGLLVSFFLHVLALLWFRSATPFPWTAAAAGPPAGDPRAALGGGAMTALVVRPPQPIVVPPRPEVTLEPVPVEVEPVPEVQLSLADDPLDKVGEGEQAGPETGDGLPGGAGAGDAGDAEEGLRRLVSPDPLHIPFPFAAPPEARGREVTLRVFVTAAGAVDSVILSDPTPNRAFNESLVRQAHDWTFKPARRGGREVAAWFRYTWRIP